MSRFVHQSSKIARQPRLSSASRAVSPVSRRSRRNQSFRSSVSRRRGRWRTVWTGAVSFSHSSERPPAARLSRRRPGRLRPQPSGTSLKLWSGRIRRSKTSLLRGPKRPRIARAAAEAAAGAVEAAEAGAAHAADGPPAGGIVDARAAAPAAIIRDPGAAVTGAAAGFAVWCGRGTDISCAAAGGYGNPGRGTLRSQRGRRPRFSFARFPMLE